MGIISNGEVCILGNFAKVSRKKPKNFNTEYKCLVPYRPEWREKIGGLECDCKEMLECYMPWYGFTWYHSDDCCLVKLIKQKPQLQNLSAYSYLPFLAQSE